MANPACEHRRNFRTDLGHHVQVIPRRVIAIDWSGRGGPDQRRFIWLCEVVDDQVQRLESGRLRKAVVEHLVALAAEDPSLVVGLDFAFSVPGWYFSERDLEAAPELWSLLADEALTDRMRQDGLRKWINDLEWPFWRTGRPPDLTPDRAFRQTELEIVAPGTQPKSVFQLVGSGQVGPASLYGMQALHELAARGFSIWPFQPARLPLVVEIFPRLLTGAVIKSNAGARARYLEPLDLRPEDRAAAIASEDAFDALVSALVMAEASSSLATLDDRSAYMLEGRIWTRPEHRMDSTT